MTIVVVFCCWWAASMIYALVLVLRRAQKRGELGRLLRCSHPEWN